MVYSVHSTLTCRHLLSHSHVPVNERCVPLQTTVEIPEHLASVVVAFTPLRKRMSAGQACHCHAQPPDKHAE